MPFPFDHMKDQPTPTSKLRGFHHAVEAAPIEDSQDPKNSKTLKRSNVYMTISSPNPFYVPTLDTMICEPSLVCVFRRPQIKPILKNIICIVCIFLPLLPVSSPKP